MSELILAEIEKARKNKQPTPPIGTPVQWLQRNDRRMVVAGRVIAIEGPGIVVLRTDTVGSFPKDVKGVAHCTSDRHKVPSNSQTMNSGSWDYLPGQPIPKAHYNLHEEELDKREATIVAMMEKAAREKAAKESELTTEPALK